MDSKLQESGLLLTRHNFDTLIQRGFTLFMRELSLNMI